MSSIVEDVGPFVDKYGRDALKFGAPVGIFWTCTQLAQRLCGVLKIQYGRRGSNIAGGVIVLSGITATLYVQNTFVARFVDHRNKVHTFSEQQFVRCTYVSLFNFLALGLKPFEATLPSSVIQLGSFNKIPHFPLPGKGSVPVASETANSSQRAQIQRIGKKYGCHQCGSKQLLGQGMFISDHMPPTAQVKAENQKWWRRWFKWEVGVNVNVMFHRDSNSLF